MKGGNSFISKQFNCQFLLQSCVPSFELEFHDIYNEAQFIIINLWVFRIYGLYHQFWTFSNFLHLNQTWFLSFLKLESCNILDKKNCITNCTNWYKNTETNFSSNLNSPWNPPWKKSNFNWFFRIYGLFHQFWTFSNFLH